MKYPVFEKVILLLQKNTNTLDVIYSQGVDLVNFTDPLNEVISHLFGSHFGQEGLDWIDWWCFEKNFGAREDLVARDKEGNEICKNLYELWELVEDCRLQNADYELKRLMTDEERQKIIESFFKSI